MAETAAPEEAEGHEGGYKAAHLAPEARRDWLLRVPRRGRPAGLAGWPATASVSLLATVLSWRSEAWRPVVAGLSSWQSGIALAFLHHLQWGRQVVFTFGPYGFVEDILPISHLTAALALAYVLAMSWGLGALVVAGLRKTWELLPAGAGAWAVLVIAGNFVEAPELGLGLALGLCLAALRRPGGPGHSRLSGGALASRRHIALVGLLGALAGFQLLVEANVGLVTAWLAAISALGAGPRRSRGAVVAASSLTGTFLVAWVAAGQSLGNIASYFRASWSVVAGYSAAMATSPGRRAEDYFAVVDLALLGAVYALALRGRPLGEKAAVSLALLGWVWEALKEGFVRHDLHDLVFFSLVLTALALARLPGKFAALQLGAIALAASLACAARGEPPPQMASPIEDVRALYQEVRDLAVASHWARVERRAYDTVLYTGDHLSRAALRALAGHTVAAAPVEEAIAFAYHEFRWGPEPVLQSYSAYTSYLDRLDANFLGSKDAPERILYQPFAIDGRLPAWEPPAAMLAMYCHYSPLHVAAGKWLLLGRTPDRCGAPNLLAKARAYTGQWAKLPPVPQGMVLAATFSMSAPFSAQVEDVLLKGPESHVEINDLHGRVTSYRFITGTAADLHALLVPSSLGYPAADLPPAAKQIRFVGGGWQAGRGHVLITFYALPVHRARLR
jgi:hypothetical protein